MTPQFPYRNFFFHEFYEYFGKEFAFNLYDDLYLEDKADTFYYDKISFKNKMFDDSFAPFEAEINQTIYSEKAQIISALFSDLKERRLLLTPLNEEFIISRLSEWAVAEEKTIDIAKFKIPYLKILSEQNNKCTSLLDRYLKRYEAGEFVSKKEDNLVERWIKKAKNNKIIAVTIIVITVVGLAARFKNDVYDLIGYKPNSNIDTTLVPKQIPIIESAGVKPISKDSLIPKVVHKPKK